jgi:hypothetical protein
MRFPDFLIIGGMKCGSTTLYRDLATHPRVFFPIDKEPENLADPRVLTDAGKAEYAAMFDSARADQLCAEASTAYTKRPHADGTAERATRTCGNALRAIYVVREPISRITSHHHHDLTYGDVAPDLADAIESHPDLIDFTRYAHQARPWIDALGADRVRIIRFEDYTGARAETTAELQSWLGLDPRPDLVEEDKVFNKSEGKPVMTGGWRSVQGNPVYQKLIRPLLPMGIKDRLRNAVLPKAKHQRQRPSPELGAAILDRLADDHDQLRRMMGLTEPVWDRDATLAELRRA